VTIDPTQPVAGASAGSGAMLCMMVRLLLRMPVLLPRGLPPSSSQVVHATSPKARKRPLKCTTSWGRYYQRQSRFALVSIRRRCRGRRRRGPTRVLLIDQRRWSYALRAQETWSVWPFANLTLRICRRGGSMRRFDAWHSALRLHHQGHRIPLTSPQCQCAATVWPRTTELLSGGNVLSLRRDGGRGRSSLRKGPRAYTRGPTTLRW
jgi:hypothetical protein